MIKKPTVRQFSLKWAVVFVMLSAPCFPASAAADERNVYAVVQSFTWREIIGGQQFVKESGPLFGAGFSYYDVRDHLTLKPTVEIFLGRVDYNGYACDSAGNCEAATTDVVYAGLKLDGDVGRRFSSSARSSLEPFAGLGFRFWRRDIRNGTTASGAPTSGYVENWIVLHGRLGMRAAIDLADKKQIFAEAGIKLPIYNENTAYLSDIGQGPDITLHPGRQAAYFAEAGVKISRFKGSLFYDTLRFSQSPTVSRAFQPESRQDVYGVKLGVVF